MNELLIAAALICQNGYTGHAKVKYQRHCVAEIFLCLEPIKQKLGVSFKELRIRRADCIRGKKAK